METVKCPVCGVEVRKVAQRRDEIDQMWGPLCRERRSQTVGDCPQIDRILERPPSRRQ